MKSIAQRLLGLCGYRVVKKSDPTNADTVSGRWCVEFKNVTHLGAQYFVPGYASHRPAAKAIVQGRYYEPKTHDIIRHIGEIETGELVHAGTFFGDMLPSFAQSFRGGKILCFEPVLENYVLARLCVSANQIDNVLLFNTALSNSISNLRIETVDADGAHKGGGSEISDRGDIIPSLTIDQFDFDNLVCIQLDVEGHELKALEGAQASIKKHQPIIFIEDNSNTCKPFLSSLGYEFCGAIPGLKIWASQKRKAMVDGFLTSNGGDVERS